MRILIFTVRIWTTDDSALFSCFPVCTCADNVLFFNEFFSLSSSNAENFPDESYKMVFFSNLQNDFRCECSHATSRVTLKKIQAQEHSQYEYLPLCEAVFLIHCEGALSLISYKRNNIISVSLLSPTPVHTWEAKPNEFQLQIRW